MSRRLRETTLAWLPAGSLSRRRLEQLQRLIDEPDDVKPGTLPGDLRALRGIPAIGGRGSLGGAIPGTRPGEDL